MVTSGVEKAVVADLLRESMAQGRTPFLTVTSNSMAPLLRRGDQIAVEAVTPNDLRPGDVIVIDGPATLITHRFWGTAVEEGRIRLVTRGDRPLAFDALWDPGRVLGRVTRRGRNGRELALGRGPGRVLNHHLAHLAALERRLFAGFTPNPLAPDRAATRLGAAFRANRRHLPSRLVRRAIYTWAVLCTTIVHLFTYFFMREDMKNTTQRLALTTLIFALLATVLWHPGRDAHASVSLSNFYAESGNDSIILHWVTENELNNLGFNLWRGTSCDPAVATRLNPSLIASQASGQATGATYEFTDPDVDPGVTYDYRLESIDSSTGGECHQDFPVQASLNSGGAINTPTAGGGSPTALATSTTAPTATPQPTATTNPGQNNPTPTRTPGPAEANTATPTPTATVVRATAFPTATGAPETGNATQVPATPTRTAGPEEAAGSAATATLPAGTPATDTAAEVAAATTGQAAVIHSDTANPAGEADDAVPPAIGASGNAAGATTGSNTTATSEDADTAGPALPNWAIMILLAGLVFVVGGSATTVYLLKNR